MEKLLLLLLAVLEATLMNGLTMQPLARVLAQDLALLDSAQEPIMYKLLMPMDAPLIII